MRCSQSAPWKRPRSAPGAEFDLVGRESTAWYSGAETSPPILIPDLRQHTLSGTSAVGDVIEGVRLGHEVGIEEIVTLFSARGPELSAVAQLADELRAEVVGDVLNMGSQPQHQLHQCMYLQMPLLRLLEGPTFAESSR